MTATRYLVALLLAPILTGCLATQGALDTLNSELAEATAAAAAAKQAAENPEVTQATVDQLFATAVEQAKEAKDAAAAVAAAAKEDFQGVLGMGGGVDGGAIGLGLTALAWFMRDRRKKLGLDPLQRANVPTPPTTA